MRTIRALSAAASLACLALAPVAQAQWAAPVTISMPHEFIGGFAGGLQAAGGLGGTLVSWTFQDGLGMHPPRGARAATARPGGAFGMERALPASFLTGPMVSIGAGRLAQLILTPRALNQTRPSVSLGSGAGGFGAPLPIRGTVYAGRSSLAGNVYGDLLASWIAADVHGGHRVVWASMRRAGGAFAPPEVLARGTSAEGVSAAIGRSGRMVVVFDSGRGRLRARMRDAHGGWGTPRDLGTAAIHTENDVTPFVSCIGEVVVAWYHTQLCEGGCVSPGFIDVAVRPAAGRVCAPWPHPQLWEVGSVSPVYIEGAVRPAAGRDFIATRVLERDATGIQGAPAGVSLAPVILEVPWFAPRIPFLAPSGRAAPGSPPTPTAVRVSHPNGAGYLASGSRYSTPLTLSPPGEQASGLAGVAGMDGELLTWIRQDPPGYFDGTVFASVTPFTLPTESFGAPEQVSPSQNVSTVRAAFDSASRWPQNPIVPWTLAWTARPAGEGPGVSVRTLVRVSAPLCSPPRPDPPRAGAG